MRKNVASQVVGAQVVSATDGSAFTGSVTCSVTGDGGTQATGSVGSGACTHEGNGFHTYAPAQAETNYDHVAFTFTGTGAIPVTVQVYTTFPQTGDSYARLGAPAGASVSADIAAIEAQTDDIGAAGAGLTAIPWNAAWDAEVQSEATDALNAYDPPTRAELSSDVATLATAANLSTLAAYVDTEVAAILAAVDTEIAAIKAVTDLLPDAGALSSLATAAALATVDTNVDSILADTGTDGVVIANGGITSAKFGAGAIDAAAIAADAGNEIADALLNRNLATGTDSGSETVRTVRQALRALRNKVSIAAGTLTVTKEDDSTASWTADVTTTAGDPVSEIDPASA